MNIIIPMAGMGKRMRPHTLTTPKPLLPIAGKPIVRRLAEDIAQVCASNIESIGFVISRSFGQKAEDDLMQIASDLGAIGHISYQDEALGTAHAVYCAANLLEGNVIVAFADTLFKADFTIDPQKDGIIWVQKVADPSAFGVVKINQENIITDFIEKPEVFVSDLAIIGIYYFKDGARVKKEIEYLLDNDIKEKGEYQLTNVLENMKNDGLKLVPGEVTNWMDCGNKNATVQTNQQVLGFLNGSIKNGSNFQVINSKIIQPCYIGENVIINDSTIGPFVSIGDNTQVDNSVISNSILQSNSKISNSKLENSMIGNFVEYDGSANELSLSDYSTCKKG